MDVKKVTRARAEKLVAGTTDEETLRRLAGHANKHVVAKATYKLKLLAARASS
jgi:hypothetical protein